MTSIQKTGKQLILASASPRRQDLLLGLGLKFQVIKSDVDETSAAGQLPVDTVKQLAVKKAEAVSEMLSAGGNYLILAADTIVVIDEQILGKPDDALHAKQMLQLLSGRTHKVLTGVCLKDTDAKEIYLDYQTTHVHFRQIKQEEIDFCIASGETMDKAGAYALQGLAACFVDKIEGCFTNVIGLPLPLTINMLRKAGLTVLGA